MDSKIEPVAWERMTYADCPAHIKETASKIVASFGFNGATLEGAIAAALLAAEQRGRESEWMPIETADKTTMILACRPDSKTFMCQWMHSDEIEEYPDDAEPHEGWWSGVYGWLEREEAPQFWMPLPLPPAKVVAAAIRKGEPTA